MQTREKLKCKQQFSVNCRRIILSQLFVAREISAAEIYSILLQLYSNVRLSN
jgi:hypothetical protein